jgi:hypothetical protein
MLKISETFYCFRQTYLAYLNFWFGSQKVRFVKKLMHILYIVLLLIFFYYDKNICEGFVVVLANNLFLIHEITLF